MLGDENACAFYRATFTRILREFGDRSEFSGRVLIATAEPDATNLFPEVCAAAGIATDLPVFLQRGDDLGERMAAAFTDAFALTLQSQSQSQSHAAGPVLLTGTDIPRYDPRIARRATELLAQHDAVLGPTPDGGYYLIGLNAAIVGQPELVREIFAGLPWSTPGVFELQMRRLESLGLRVARAPELSDVDTFEDLRDFNFTSHDAEADADENFARYAAEVRKLLPDVRVILPIFNEVENLEFVLGPIFASGYFREVICADNGSTDGSRELAERLGARVTLCTERGYGATCLTALDDIRARGGCDVVLFMDGDGADDPAYIREIIAPVCAQRVDLCLGARVPELALPGALMPHARFGNWLITRLVRWLWRFDYRDLGPFRAVCWDAYERMRMDDRNYGWTVQMQIRALTAGLRVREIPVPYRKRNAGSSKVSASLRGSYLAGKIIFRTLFREYLFADRQTWR